MRHGNHNEIFKDVKEYLPNSGAEEEKIRSLRHLKSSSLPILRSHRLQDARHHPEAPSKEAESREDASGINRDVDSWGRDSCKG